MKSVSGKIWIEKKVNKNLIEKIKQDLKYSELVSRLIVSRNFDLTEINNIDNHINISNVFTNNEDYKKATDLLINSIKNKQYICILGDYDVDGATSTSLLVRFFNYINHPYFYYIPDRVKDGYGASKKLFQKLILQKPKLVILVDCGSTSNEAIDFLNQNNIKSLIIDHHEINKPFPKSNSIINPKQNNGYLKYDYFCATTLTYFLLDILIKKIKSNFNISDYLIYVLLATVCDVMPLRKINKIIASNTLINFNIKKLIAFKSLFQITNIKRKITLDDLGYLLGPIINSGGRLNNSNLATEFLTSNDENIVKKKLYKLIELNDKRKKVENIIFDNINLKKIKLENENIIILYIPNINEGMIGIIAARLKEYFNKPSIVITNSNKLLKGSARSTENYNIGNVIKTLSDNKIIEKGGGHNMAAGFTIKKEKLKILNDFIQKDFLKKTINFDLSLKYDFELSASLINKDFVNDINKLGPFGKDNPLPIILLKNLKILKTTILNKKHITVILKTISGKTIKAICFNCINSEVAKYLLSYKKNINVMAQIHENIWNNKNILQLNIKDILI